MTWWQFLVLGAVIGTNNLAASFALGAHGQKRNRLRIVAVFGIFEFTIPLVGMLIGKHGASLIANHASWIGAALMIGVGIWSIVGGIRSNPRNEKWAERAATFRGLALIAAALSIDNLVIGFGLGLRGASPLTLAAVIAAFSVTFSWIGVGLGDRIERHWEGYTQIAAGALLILLGIAALLDWI